MQSADDGHRRRSKLPELIGSYDGILLDAYGVLVDAMGALPGARELALTLSRESRSYLVVTNDASRLPETKAARFSSLGIEIPAERILTSGMLLAAYFDEQGLSGARTLVLGGRDSREYVAQAGGEVMDIDGDAAYDAIVIADDDGYPFFEGVDAALSAIIRGCEGGTPPALILPNPDLIYPKARGQFGFTAGSVALLIEAGAERRLGPSAPHFVPLGKPNAPIFQAAKKRIPGRLLMVGDQLETDIAGANAAGIDTALLLTGVTRNLSDSDIAPTHILDALWP